VLSLSAGAREEGAESRNQGMEDDEVLLATSDDDESLPERVSSPSKVFQGQEETSRSQAGDASTQGELHAF